MASGLAAFAAGAGEGIVTSAFNAWQAERARDYNREMASTAHQREVKDLRAAGLNPILSAGGHGASVAPSPTAQAGHMGLSQSVIQAVQLRQQEKLIDAQVSDINAAAKLKQIEGRIMEKTESEKIDSIREALYKLKMDADISSSQSIQLDRVIKELDVQSRIHKLQESHSALDLSRSRSESRFYEGLGGDVEHWLKMLGIQMPRINIFRGGNKNRKGSDANHRPHRSNYDTFKNYYNSKKGGD